MHWPQAMVYEGTCRASETLLYLTDILDDNPFPMTPEGQLKTTEYPFEKVWAVMEKVYESGRVKAIGVSNFSIKT